MYERPSDSNDQKWSSEFSGKCILTTPKKCPCSGVLTTDAVTIWQRLRDLGILPYNRVTSIYELRLNGTILSPDDIVQDGSVVVVQNSEDENKEVTFRIRDGSNKSVTLYGKLSFSAGLRINFANLQDYIDSRQKYIDSIKVKKDDLSLESLCSHFEYEIYEILDSINVNRIRCDNFTFERKPQRFNLGMEWRNSNYDWCPYSYESISELLLTGSECGSPPAPSIFHTLADYPT